jgi:putative ABC transport system substrate-binding protein
MKRRVISPALSTLLFALSWALLLALSLPAEAQEPKKVPRIGYLNPRSGPGTREDAFRQGLRELGYLEGKNIIIEYRWAAGKYERLRELADELARLKVHVFVTAATRPTLAAKEAGGTIPIVMAEVGDPVALGLVASLARPGGNITGLTVYSSELTGKRLQMLMEIVPRASRIGVLASPPFTIYGDLFVRETEAAGRELGVQIKPHRAGDPRELEGAFAAMKREGARALLVQISPVFMDHRERIVSLAARSRMPAMYEDAMFPDAGGLTSYGPNHEKLYWRAAFYVDKILKGTKPADLPVEQPTKLEFIINLTAAKQIGLTIPPNVLARADRVIK